MKRGILCTALLFLLFVLLSSPALAQVSFFQPPTYSGALPNLFVADFNGDGKMDLLNSDGTMNLGNGDGTFTKGTAVSVASGSSVLAVADFNGDGKPDVLEQGTGTLLVLLGNGDGTFQPAISTTSGASLTLLAAADLNGDGKADVVGVFNGLLYVYLSNGDGTFATPAHTYALGSTPVFDVSFGDFDGDLKTDIVVSTANGSSAGQEIVFLGNGDGTFQATPKTSVGVDGGYVAVGDFNGDGKLDLAISGDILLGNGDGTFQTPKSAFPTGPVAAADVNGDGKLDLVIGNAGVSEIYLGNGDGTFSNAGSYALGFVGGGSGPVIADFNGDGKPDVATGNVVLLGNGNGTFQGIRLSPVPLTGTSAGLIGGEVFADFEKKGTADIALVSNQSVYILSNNGSGVLSVINTYTVQQPGYGLVTADFNGDGNLDLVVFGTDSTTGDWSYSVLLGNGDGSFQAPVFYSQSVQTQAKSYSVVVADFNNDRKLDIAVTSGNQNLALLLGNGDGTFSGPTYVFDANASSLVSADFNGDGKLDIAGAALNGTVQSTVLLLGNGDGTFQLASFPSSLNGFAVLSIGDLNNDSKGDLVSGDGQFALSNGNGTFTVLPGGSANLYATADFNGDGKLDVLVLQYYRGFPNQSGVMLGNGDGTYGSLINVPNAGYLPFGLLVADMNGDGRPDIVFPVAGSGLAVLLNTTSAGFGVSAGALSPSPVTAGNSAASSVTVTPAFGFNQTVTLACKGLPSGASCTFNPTSITGSSGTSALTITTSANVAAGTYAVQIQGSAGSIVNSMPLSLVVQAAPDFTIGAASGSPTSQTITPGQTASFSLAFAPLGSFTGTVNLTCAITPVVTPAPTCSLPSTVQISGSGTQSVTVKVATTGTTASMAFYPNFPPAAKPLTWSLLLLGSTWLLLRSRNRRPALAAPVVVLAFVFSAGCGGSSSSSHGNSGTPAGTYAATVTATSGSLSHTMPLTVLVQ